MFGKVQVGTTFARLAAMPVLCTALACLMPPAYEVLEEFTNSAPYIDPDSIFPSPVRGAPEMGPGCYAEVRASINDPDGDTLYVRWFVDYPATDIARGDAKNEPEVIVLQPDPSGNDLLVTFTPNGLDGNLSSAFAAVDELEVHQIELFVADRPFEDAFGSALPGRTLSETDGEFVSYTWPIILLEDESECDDS